MKINLANALTIFRIAVIPVIIAFFYIPEDWAVWAAVFVYTIAAVTDFFDGWVARTYNQVSAFGRFLDPIADKLVVGVALMLVVAFDRIDGLWVIPAIIILVREIFIAGLREFLAPYKVSLPVSKLAKWKTAAQLIAIGFLIAGEQGSAILPYAHDIGRWGLLAACFLTVISGWDYMKVGYNTIKELDQNPQ